MKVSRWAGAASLALLAGTVLGGGVAHADPAASAPPPVGAVEKAATLVRPAVVRIHSEIAVRVEDPTGTLLPTPLRGPDGSVVALGQGPLSIGGFGVGNGGGNAIAVNHLTVGRVPGGGMVQIARQTALAPADELRLALRDPDFVSALVETRQT